MPIRDEAINVFMTIPGDGDEPRLELTYNYGVDRYELGSAYGHIAITAGDLDDTLERLAGLGEGGSRICFVRDPDGYRVEIVERPAKTVTVE